MEVEEGVRFTDEQLRGPYRRWVHEHAFEPHPKGALVCDRITYELPLGPLGRLAHRLFVRRQLEGIFNYRAARLEELLESAPDAPSSGAGS